MSTHEDDPRDFSLLEQAAQDTPRDHPAYASRHAEVARDLLQRYERLQSTHDLMRAIARMQSAVEATPPIDPDYIPRHADLAMMLVLSYEQSHSSIDLDRAIDSMNRAIQITPPDSPVYSSRQAFLGIFLLQRYQRQPGNMADLDDAIALLPRAALVEWIEDIDHAMYKVALGTALRVRSVRLGDATDLEKAIAQLEWAERVLPQDHLAYVACQDELGMALLRRYKQSTTETDLQWAIARLERAATAVSIDSATYADCQGHLGEALLSRYERSMNDTDLDEGVACFERATQAIALDQTNSAGSALLHANLGVSLLRRYDARTEVTDLQRAIAQLEQAVGIDGSDAFNRAQYKMFLGGALVRRYELWEHLGDLERAITCLEDAARAIPPDNPDFAVCQCDLGTALVSLYERSWDLDDLERAIVLLEQAAQTASSDVVSRSSLGRALLRRYEKVGHPPDLERSIAHLEHVVQVTAPDSPHYGPFQLNLGMALLRRYEQFRAADAADLERAISCFESVVEVISPTNPFLPTVQHNLGTALRYRHERMGDVDDLDVTVRLMEQAARAALSDSTAFVMCQIGLGGALMRRHAHSRAIGDLDDAIACFRRAMETAPPGSLHHTMCQVNAGGALTGSYEYAGRSHDLDDGVTLLTSAARAILPTSPFFATCQSNLGGGLLMRYRRSRLLDDLEQGIACLRAAAQAAPTDIACQTNLGMGLLLRHEHSGRAADREDAIARYAAAVTIAEDHSSQHTQWQAYHRLASVLDGAGRLAEAFDAANAACQRIAAVSGALSEGRSLAYLHGAAIDDAFAHALRLALRLAAQVRLTGDEDGARRYEEHAFRIAEMNKGRWFVALLAARAQALPNAPDENSDIIRQLTELRGRLMEAYRRDDDGKHSQLASLAPGVPAEDRHEQRVKTSELERAYLAVVEQLRAAYPELAALTTVDPQPLAVVQQTLGHGDALLELVPLPEALTLFVLTRDRLLVDSIPLPIDRLREWTSTVVPSNLPGAMPVPEGEAQAAALRLMAEALWPRLGELLDRAVPGWRDPCPDAAVPHLLLVPTAPLHRWPLHLLPLPDGRGQLLDRFAVCYAATSDTPHYCLRHAVAAPPQLLALAPSTDLPFTQLESRAVQALAPGLDPREGVQATVEALRASSANARWIVLATHARVDGALDPAGQVLLHDGTACAWVRPHELIARVRLRAEHLSLTACLAHGTDPEAGDNLVGLTRALLYAGCRSLLTTLWAIDDAEALVLDHAFWEHFITGRDSAARCLRMVLRARRDEGLGWLADRGRVLLEVLRSLPGVDATALAELENRVGQWEDEAALHRLGKVVLDARGVPVDSATLWGAFILHGAPHVRADKPLGDGDMIERYVALVGTDVERFGPEQQQWLAALERDYDDVMAVLRWAQQTGRAEIGLQLAASLWRFWIAHNRVDEGLRWLNGWLSTTDADVVGPAMWAAALHGGGVLAGHAGERVTAERWLGEAVTIRRRLNDRAGTAASLLNLANIALGQRDDERAVAQLEESLALWRDLGDEWGQALALGNLGQAARLRGDYGRAAALLTESTDRRRAIGDQGGLAKGLALLGAVSLEMGMGDESERHYEESVALYRMLDHPRGQAGAVAGLARARLVRGDLAGAQASWVQALSLYQQIGDRLGVVTVVEGIAALTCRMQQHERGVKLYAAAHAARASIGMRAMRLARTRCEGDVSTARQAVGSAAVHTAWEIGQLLSLEQAVALAQDVRDE